jgi:hypothetical protein
MKSVNALRVEVLGQEHRAWRALRLEEREHWRNHIVSPRRFITKPNLESVVEYLPRPRQWIDGSPNHITGEIAVVLNRGGHAGAGL